MTPAIASILASNLPIRPIRPIHPISSQFRPMSLARLIL